MRDFAVMETPIGNVRAEVLDDYLISLKFTDESVSDKFLDGLLMELRIQLGLYFQGKQKTFDIPVALGGTEFQRKVWMIANTIPFGETTTYEKIAQSVGSPGAVRAVGSAMGLNPILLIMPCHRVVGKSGSLTGYAGGLWRKSKLLEMEGSQVHGKQFSLSF
jgi:methylated-DNA-[protein]-cysteine S-methyltransferase